MERLPGARPRVPYSEIYDRIDGHDHITYEERIQVKAIDIMVEALLKQEDRDKVFDGYTVCDKSRLTNHNDPDYGSDLLMGVHTPQEFLDHVIHNEMVEVGHDNILRDSGFMDRWGTSMREIAKPEERDLPDEAKAKKLVRDLLVKNSGLFLVESGELIV